MAYQTVLNTQQIEDTKRLIGEHTDIITGFFTNDNNAFSAALRILDRAAPTKDPDIAITALKAYVSDRIGLAINQNHDKTLACNFTQTGLNLVDWYAVLSILQEIKDAKDLDQQPF
jgi:hypothetical protein